MKPRKITVDGKNYRWVCSIHPEPNKLRLFVTPLDETGKACGSREEIVMTADMYTSWDDPWGDDEIVGTPVATPRNVARVIKGCFPK